MPRETINITMIVLQYSKQLGFLFLLLNSLQISTSAFLPVNTGAARASSRGFTKCNVDPFRYPMVAKNSPHQLPQQQFMNLNHKSAVPSRENLKSWILKASKENTSSEGSEENQEMEEVLLMMKLSSDQSLLGCETSFDDRLEQTRKFLRSFPFAAVLPVQPLQYLPSDKGVEVTFLRKKTKEKGSMDGGIQIDAMGLVKDKDIDMDNETDILILARRNSEGQTVGKVFSEKIVVLELVERMNEVQEDLGVKVQSIYHKWL